MEGVGSGPRSERQHNARKYKKSTNEASMLLKTQDGFGKRTQNELKTNPDLSAKCANQIQIVSFPVQHASSRGNCAPKCGRVRKRSAVGSLEQPRKIQKTYDRSQYVIENTGSALKNERETNSKRSLFERKMRGLNTKSGSSEMSPDAVMPGPSPFILSEAKNLRSWLRASHAGILVPISAKHPGRPRFLVSLRRELRHSHEGGNPLDRKWVPAFAGTTRSVTFVSTSGPRTFDRSEGQSLGKHKIVGTKLRSR